MRLGWLSRLVVERRKERGDRAFLVGDYGGALGHYRKARRHVRDHDPEALVLDALIGECLARRPQPETEAARERRDAERAHAGPAWGSAAADLLDLALGDKAPGRAAEYRELGPTFATGYVALVQGEIDRAVAERELAAAAAPDAFVVRLELGRALSLAGAHERAREELERALERRPEDGEALLLLAAVLVETGRADEAARRLEPIVRRGEADAETLFTLGRAYAAKGEGARALELFREALRKDPKLVDAYYEAAGVLEGQGDVEAAFALLVRACALAPDEIDFNRALARLVLEHDLDVHAGLAACDRLMILDEASRWRTLGWIGELYLRAGWRKEARDPLRKALELVPAERREERDALARRLAEVGGEPARGTS